MCLIIAVISFVFAFNLYISKFYMYSFFSVSVGVFFVYLMIKNIISVKKRKELEK